MAKKYDKKYSKGMVFGDWTLVSYLGGGGNGEVWKCQDSNSRLAAIKLLKSPNKKSYDRFRIETNVISSNQDIEGTIPLIDKYLPENQQDGLPFFVMPIAEKIEGMLDGKSMETKVDAIIQVSETLQKLHSRGISHRDIKPPNLMFYSSRYCISDFGLVDYPDKQDISQKNEVIGAKWTMAPEMRRESSKADGKKADVYSLAKTLWILLTENPKGFDGQYSPNSILELKQFYQKAYTTPIDELLSRSTDNDPGARPDITEFLNVLKHWRELSEDFHKRNMQQWFEIQTKLFPTGFPKSVVWENIPDIINVLKMVASYDNLNHMFYPDGGGLDLIDAKLSAEPGCIELDSGLTDIIKPKRLLFESFGKDAEWNYFRLELEELAPSGVYKERRAKDEPSPEEHDIKRGHEALSELRPGEYGKYELVEYRFDYLEDGRDIPDTARHVTRWFRGAFVIFNKRSTYNRISATYDGRHNKMTADEFRAYIQTGVDHSNKTK